MHALIWPVMVVLFGGLGFSQGERSLGVTGLVLPGPAAVHLNPAFAAFPAGFYGSDPGFRLPPGVLGLVFCPESNPPGAHRGLYRVWSRPESGSGVLR
jgi:hypothetical protein